MNARGEQVCRCVRWLDACKATDTCDGHTVLWGFGGHAMVGEAFCSDSSYTEALESPTVRSDGCTDLMLGSYGLGSSPFACALEHVCKRHGDTVRLQSRL
jgi:hypothetical protein